MKKLPSLGFSIPIIFMMQGLANVDGECCCWGSEELSSMRNIIEFHKNFQLVFNLYKIVQINDKYLIILLISILFFNLYN